MKKKNAEPAGQSTGGPRDMRTPHYSRTLNHASKTGLGSSDSCLWGLCVQLQMQEFPVHHGRLSEGYDCVGRETRGVRGSGRPPPWPPPAAWTNIL